MLFILLFFADRKDVLFTVLCTLLSTTTTAVMIKTVFLLVRHHFKHSTLSLTRMIVKIKVET